MKTLPIIAVVSLLATALACQGQTTIFNDTFPASNHSVLNSTAASPGPLTSTQTSYEIASSKSATSTTLGTGALTFGNFSTSSGYCEGQALFTGTPVTLNTPGQSIEVFYVITDTTTLFNGNANLNEQVSIGLYNSGGSAPTNGAILWVGGLLASSNQVPTGACQNWLGYCGEIAYTTAAGAVQSSAIYTRPAQTGANNLNQGLCPVSGYASGVNIGQLTGVQGQPAFTVGNQYTVDLTITYVNATTLAITNSIYVGAGTGGAVYSSGGFTARNSATVTGANLLTSTFDGLCIGFRPTSSPTTAETMQINQVKVLTVTPSAPGITGLTNQTIIQGNNAVLQPTVAGSPTPACQWYLSTDGGVTSNTVSGATSASLTLTNVQYSQNNYIYSLVATNSLGTNVASMTLSVIVLPSITGLNNQAGSVGDTITISPTVSGEPAPTLQWQTNGVNISDGTDANGSTISGSTTSTLTIADAQAGDSATYSLIASNSAGLVTNSMMLTVSSGNIMPSLVGPTNITVIQGNNGTFSAIASGVPVPTLQWLDQTGTPILGATTASLTLNNVQFSQNGFVYSVVASNTVGSVTNSATLTVIVPPAITSQPVGLTVTNTQSASFAVAATGEPAPTYQWYKNNVVIDSGANPSATNATFSIGSTVPADAASYYVQISNAAGSTNSATVTLTVNSTMAATAFSPANGAAGICYDTPLTVTFSSAPSLGTSGAIKIFNVTNSATPVDTIYATNGLVQQRTFPGDGQSFSYKTIVTNGATVTIYPHPNVLTSNQTYYVTIDNGTFTDAAGANFAGITANNLWQFATKVGGPANPTNIVVNPNGSADFLTVQGAVNSVPSGSTTPRVINISNGIYTEIVDIAGKNNVTFRGQSRTGTLVGYPNNATFQAANSGTTHARMAFKVDANDIALDNLTVTNMTPQGGSQAEALMIETSAARCIVNNCTIYSRQDTILANTSTSQGYFYKSTVLGNYDYIWGGGNLYFDQCVMDTVGGTSSDNLTAARTGTAATISTTYPWLNPGATYTANGMSFVNCSLTADSGVGTVTLADANGTAGELVSWYGCNFATNYIAPASTLFSGNFIFWQDMNTMSNSPVTFANVTSISGTDAQLLAATNIPTWLYGWTPQLAPNILTNPVSQTVTAGAAVTFTVVATGIPDPTYQWQTNGVAISGATGATFTIASVALSDANSYSVVVTTPAGSVTSTPATLTVNPPVDTAPVFTAPPAGTNIAINVGVNLSVACTATDTDLPPPTLTYVLLAGPSGAAVDSSSGNLTWRPTTSFAGTINPVSVSVTDNGTPSLSATNQFTITVNPLSSPTVASPSYSGGQFNVSINGQIGPDYALQATTNLASGTWTTVVTTNSPATMPVLLSDPNAGSQPMQFYRTVTGPPLP